LGDLRSSLRHLTNRIIEPNVGLYKGDITKVHSLDVRRDKILASDLSPLGKIYWLLEDCKRYGTLPFAGLARAGFIAVQMLRSLVAREILSQAECDQFLSSINTVAKRLAADVARMWRGDCSREHFLRQYGHLRPGTYDILSKRYDEDPDAYFGALGEGQEPETVEPFSLTDRQLERLSYELARAGIVTDGAGLLKFIQEAIEGREYAKFIFSKNLSDALQLIVTLGAKLGFTRDDLSYLDIAAILNMYSSSALPDLSSVLAESIANGKKLHETAKRLKLPPLICSPEDIYLFSLEIGEPNYITLGKVCAEAVSGKAIRPETCRGHIVFIESADPGYDWIFSHGIVGLITMYGGANSHMAIRAAELGIPAVIGCGEKLYTAWSRARMLEIDAMNKNVRVIA
jgi:hypothetical protein